MGKWSAFKGREGQYLVDCTNRVVQLQRYLYQDYYADPDGEKVCVKLDRIFSSKEEAEALSKKLIADFQEKQQKWAQERAIEEEAEKARIEASRRKPEDKFGFSERRYYLD